ncbi:hypothetical protein T09_14689 [Trichinella sp. T9]|nr:hypothetical protein T09_14689 [Trichinella sp. T9]
MSYSNFFHLTLNKVEECNPHDYSVFQCVEQQSRSAHSSSPQYHLQFQKCHVSERLLCWSSQEKTHKCHINIEITGSCIRQSFTISYMHKFICMLNAREESVRNAYISLTEKERQYEIYSNAQHSW